LYLGGAGLARGYLNRPDLTEERFIADPFNSGERLYRTGDLVRYLADGNLAFIGRIDDQVKIRGFRIELGEIEHQLSLCEGVQSSAVLVREDVPGEKQLVGYVVRAGDYDIEDNALVAGCRTHLGNRLPGHMVPSSIVVVDEFPLTLNGKVDRKNLPAPGDGYIGVEYVAASTEIEHRLVEIWSELLKCDASNVGVTSNFFELGGHSLLAVRVCNEIERCFSQLKVSFMVNDVFAYPTIKLCAERIELFLLIEQQRILESHIGADVQFEDEEL
jgi:hypothetical protein